MNLENVKTIEIVFAGLLIILIIAIPILVFTNKEP